jgi:hypothetical protein
MIVLCSLDKTPSQNLNHGFKPHSQFQVRYLVSGVGTDISHTLKQLPPLPPPYLTINPSTLAINLTSHAWLGYNNSIIL